MSARTEILNEEKYAGLLAQTLPHVLHTEAENEECTAKLESLEAKTDLSPEEDSLAELLTLLIEDFEERNYALPPASPLEVVRHLMDVNDLQQSDMVDVFGSASVASQVLNGKRGLSKAHIEKLSKRFNVSPALFFTTSAGERG